MSLTVTGTRNHPNLGEVNFTLHHPKARWAVFQNGRLWLQGRFGRDFGGADCVTFWKVEL